MVRQDCSTKRSITLRTGVQGLGYFGQVVSALCFYRLPPSRNYKLNNNEKCGLYFNCIFHDALDRDSCAIVWPCFENIFIQIFFLLTLRGNYIVLGRK